MILSLYFIKNFDIYMIYNIDIDEIVYRQNMYINYIQMKSYLNLIEI